MPKKIFKRVLIISDLHAPYSHPDTLPFLKALKKKYRFDKVVSVGDEVDYHAISFHDSDPSLPSATEELQQAIDTLKPIYKLFPKVDLVESNHGSLVLRKALVHGLPHTIFKSYNQILQAPKGWVWLPDMKIDTPLGQVYICHGKSGVAGRLTSQYGMSSVQGHYHSLAQVTYISTPDALLWDMHVGCLIDDSSRAMAYNKLTVKRPIISVGIIIDGIPAVIPMVLNAKGRWIKKL